MDDSVRRFGIAAVAAMVSAFFVLMLETFRQFTINSHIPPVFAVMVFVSLIVGTFVYFVAEGFSHE